MNPESPSGTGPAEQSIPGIAGLSSTKLLWLFAWLIVASVITLAYSFYRQFQATTLLTIERELSNLAQVLAEEVEGDIIAATATLRRVSVALAESGPPRNAGDAEAARKTLRDAATAHMGGLDILYSDPAGLPIVHSRFTDLAGLDLHDRDYITAHRQRPQSLPHIGVPVLGRLTNRWRLPLSLPVLDTRSRLIGIVSTSLDLEGSKRSYHSLRLGYGGGVAIMHREGLLVAAVPTRNDRHGVSFSSHPLFRDLLATRTPLIRGPGILSSDEAFMAARPIADSPLLLIISQPVGENLVQLEAQRNYIIAFTVALIIAVLLFASLFARQLRQREQTEAALRESRSALLESQRLGRLGSWSVDLKSSLVTLSDQARAILDLKPDDMLGSPQDLMTSLVHPDERGTALDNYRQILTGRVIESERRIVTADGRVKWLRTRTEPILVQGEPTVVHGTIQEVTEVKEAELRLADSERGYRLLSENTRDLVSLHDVDGRLLMASLSFKRITGHVPADLIGTDFHAWMHADDAVRVRSEINQQLRTGKVELQTEFRFRHQAGHYLWLECLAASVHDSRSGTIHLQASSRDVTERRRTLIALKDSEERFRRIIEFTSDLYWETDSEYRFTLMSVGAAQYLDLVPNSLGRRRWEVSYNRASDEVWEQHKADIAARRQFKDLQMEFVHPVSGAILEYCSFSGEPFYDEDGKFRGYRGIGRFITRQKRYELDLAERTRQLSAANTELNKEAGRRREVERRLLLAIEKELAQVGLELHDELGQNLTGTALLAKTLQKKLTEKGIPEAADAARVHALVNETIRQTRLISHGLSPHILGPDGLVEALQQLADDVNSLGMIECRFECDGEPQIADTLMARGLYRIAQEAVNNALKHSQAKSIMIELANLDGETRLAVIDNGIGIGTDSEALSDSALHSIKYRAGVLNAALSVIRRPGGGTEVAVALAAETPQILATVKENE